MTEPGDPRSEADERRLIQRVTLASDTQAFDALVAPYLSRLAGYLRGLAGDDADDLAQKTLLKAWSNLHRFSGEGRFIAWLFRIAQREFLQHLRQHRRYRAAMSDYHASDEAATAQADGTAAAIDVERILASLEPEVRAMLLLSRAVGLTHGEIATLLDKPLGSVKSTISRTTQQLVKTHAA